ncbi:MAG: hypothetical protein ACXWC2_03620 [Ramlibacter sp.]
MVQDLSSRNDHAAWFAAIRQAVHVARCECICEDKRPLCLLSDTLMRAAVQPFVYL